MLGDVPYNAGEVRRVEKLIDEMNAQELAFVVHVGDIGNSARNEACADAWLEARKAQFARLRHRFVFVPGDNEWTDCARHGLDPLARLRKLRELFCAAPGEWCEHQIWQAGGWVFVTLNVPGSNNNIDHPEHGRRMQAVFGKLEEAAKLAESRAGLVIFMQANPFIYPRRPEAYDELKRRLRALGTRLPDRIVLIHGDTHLYRDDFPLPGLRRVEVWGSPFVNWLRGSLHPDGLRIAPAR